MTQIFVFTAGNPDARDHLVASIENPIDQDTVFGSFSSADREDLERIRDDGNGFYAWGALPGAGNERTSPTVSSCDQCPTTDFPENTICADLAPSPDAELLTCERPCPQ